MIRFAKAGEVDLILTKEVSRFARNTVDTLQYTRDLKKIGVYVLFMNDNINTKDTDAELRLTIMASIAQEESRRTSERVKWGQKRRMEQGVVFGRDMLGYDVRGGKLYINEKGAGTVRLLYHKFLEEGKGTCTIARELREANIETSTHMKEWSNTVIRRVLKNEKYCGDLVQKKTYTPDFLSHEKKINLGQEEYVILRDHHEPIISRETFEKTQKELERRALSREQKAKHSNRYCLSGKIQCGCCGCRFVSRVKKRKDKSRYKAWRCYEAARHGLPKTDQAGNQMGCAVSRQIRDEDFMEMIQTVIRSLQHNRERLISDLAEIVRSVLAASEGGERDMGRLERKFEALAEKKERLLDLYLGQEISKEDCCRTLKRYDGDMEELKRQLKEAGEREEIPADPEERMADITGAIRGLAWGEKQDDTFYRNMVETIVVRSGDHIDIYLNHLPHRWSFVQEN